MIFNANKIYQIKGIQVNTSNILVVASSALMAHRDVRGQTIPEITSESPVLS